jgi:hypothetical protein
MSGAVREPHAGPFFSIVVATYNRGAAIIPTLQSALVQSHQDFEIIVVGDGCADDTERHVREIGSPKISWLNLSQNTGAQSDPNNAGIAAARGEWICYLGHDDVWAQNHLAEICRVIEDERESDFVVSGCIYHGPEEIEVLYVTGFFDHQHDALTDIVPPSSIAHRRDVPDRIGPWSDPRSIELTVDRDFITRAAKAGMNFGSTQVVTVHKFPANSEYLAYLRPSGERQIAFMQQSPETLREENVRLVERAKQLGHFMNAKQNSPIFGIGQMYIFGLTSRGLSRAALQPLGEGQIIEQTGEARAIDWFSIEEGPQLFRVSGPNPRPRILIPFTGERAEVSLEIVKLPEHEEGKDIEVYVEAQREQASWFEEADGGKWLRFTTQLKPAGYTVVSLFIPAPAGGRSGTIQNWYRYGLGVARIRVMPILARTHG